MSVKAMGWVWDQNIERDEKFVLLAYADHADHDGGSIYPAVATIARKTGYSERSVQRITRQLVEHGWLIDMGTSKLGTHKFSMPIYMGDKMTPPTNGGMNETDLGGDKMTGGDKCDTVGVTNLQGGVTNETLRGDIAMSPEPSLTVIKPSVNRSNKSSAKRLPDERLSHPAIVVYRAIARLTPPAALRDDIISTVGDDEVQWGNIVKQWIGNGWKPGNINGMLDYYRNGGNGNGRNDKQAKRDELYALLQEE